MDWFLYNNGLPLERVKQTPPRQFSILINDIDLREIDLHGISKRTVDIEQAWDTLLIVNLIEEAIRFQFFEVNLIRLSHRTKNEVFH